MKLLVHGGTLRLAARKSVSFREVNYDCTSLARLDSATRCGRLRAIVERNGAARPENHKGLSRRIRFSKDGTQEVEFVVVNLFASLEAVRRFAGENYSVAVFEPEAQRLLSKAEPQATHYEVRADTV